MSSSIRVLHVYRTYYPDTEGGLEEVIRQICLNTRNLGVESRVFVLSPVPEPSLVKRPEAEVYRSRQNFEIASCGVGLNALSRFNELIAWCDVVNYHFPWPFGDLLDLLSRVKKPKVVTYHSDIVRQRILSKFYAPLMTRFLGGVDYIIPTSTNYAVTSQVLGQFTDKIRAIPIGISDQSKAHIPSQIQADVQEKLGKDFILFLGVIRYYKGLKILMDAVKGMSTRCVIAGGGPLEGEMQEYARRRSITNVEFIGRVNNETKLALLKLCSVLVLPSHLRSEAFGVVLVEGSMMSKPLICAEIGTGTSYVNLDGETGFVVPPDNSSRLQAAIVQLMEDSNLANTMGAAARKRYETFFSGERMGAEYADLYREINSRS